MVYDSQRPLAGFSFARTGSGCYTVRYQSDFDLLHNQFWSRRVYDMTLIDATLHCEHPKQDDVLRLRKFVKEGNLCRYD